jgi:hypothetical protein
MKIGIVQYLPKNTFVKLDDDIWRAIFKEAVEKTKTLTSLAKILNVPVGNISRYKLGRRDIPLHIAKGLLNFIEVNIESIDDHIKFKIGKISRFYARPFVEINQEWVYIAELIRCDGHIPRNLWTCQLINKNMGLINIFVGFFKNLGLLSKHIDVRNSTVPLCKIATIRSRTFTFIFNEIFDVPAGRKGEISFPLWYFKDNKYLIAAIRGAFDSEGCVEIGSKSLSPRRVKITNKSRTYIKDLKTALKRLGIDSLVRQRQNDHIFDIYIYGRINLENFLKIVTPYHEQKRRRLTDLLKLYDDSRVPEGSLKRRVLNSLVNKPKRRAEIASDLGLLKTKLSWHLKWLRENRLIEVIKKVYTNNGTYFVYEITSNGKKYLSNENRAF